MRRVLSVALILVIGGLAAFFLYGGGDQAEPVTLSGATAQPVPDRAGVLHVYLTLENGAMPNRLLAAQSPEAETARLMAVQGDVVLPARGTASLAADGAFLELTGVSGPLEAGRLIPVSLEFDRSGIAATRALIGALPDPHTQHAAAAGHHAQHGTPPELSMVVDQDAEGLWQVRLQTAHFTFAPTTVETRHVHGEGHGHLYLNGLKLGRMYSHTAEIGALPPGDYLVEVTLNGNTHLPYENADGPVAAQARIVVE